MLSSPSRFQIFKLLGTVLDQSVSGWALNAGLPLDSFVAQVKKAIQGMSDEYYSGNRPEIPFDKSFYRSAYLYEYAAASAWAVEDVINHDAENQRLISGLLTSKQPISLCCLGGGPGSEILGIAKWIERQRAGQVTLQVLVTDKYREWGHEWKSLVHEVNSIRVQSLGSLPAITGEFAQIDVEDPSHASYLCHRSGINLYIVSYVVSHIYTYDGLSRFCQFMRSVIDCAPKGSKFLFIDRHELDWQTSVATLLNYPGIEISEPYFSSSSSPGDLQEEKTDLGVLHKDLGLDISPKLKWDIFWVVGTKV